MKLRQHILQTLLLAWPVCMSNVGHVLVGVVDIAFVGGIQEESFGYSGTTAQAAVSLANGIYFLILVFGMGVSYGVTPLAAEADSSGNSKENSLLLSHGLIVNVAVNTFLFIVLLLISPLLIHLDQPAEVVDLSIPFLNVMMLGMIPLAVYTSLKQFAEGLSFTRFAMYIAVGSNLLNILLNWILIYGHWGFKPMGIMGSCWASFWSRVAMALAMLGYVYYAGPFRKYREGFKFHDIAWNRIRKIFNIGAGSGLQWLFEVGAFSTALIMVGWIGKRELAGHQIALQLASMTYLIASGISSAASVRVGNQIGMKDRSAIWQAAKASYLIILVSQSIFALLFILFRNYLPVLFNEETPVRELVASLLLIAALFQVSDGVQIVGLGVLRGIKDVVIPTWITLLSYWGIGLPACYWLAFPVGLGARGIWYGLTLALTLAAILLFLRFRWVVKTKEFS